MPINLTDWLGTHLGLLWLSIGAMLLALEWVRRDLTMAMLALGLAAAALAALVVPQAWYVHLAIGAVVGVLGVAVVKPALQRLEAQRGSVPPS
jgi:membrane protein implicated in regulation of membrane protease activity